MTLRRMVLAGLAVLLLGLQARLWIGESSLAHVSALNERVDIGVAANETRTQRNKVLRAEITDLKNGLASIEEKARSDFGLIKEGETFFLLVEEPQSRQ